MFGKIKALPIIVTLVFLVCFVSLIAESEDTGHVTGIVRVLNWQTGEWEIGTGTVHVVIFRNGQWWAQRICTITNGSYEADFTSTYLASECSRVDVTYRDQTFTEDFNYQNGTVVDIYYDPTS